MMTLPGRKAAYIRNAESGAYWSTRTGWQEKREDATTFNLGGARELASRWGDLVTVEEAEWLPFTGEDQARYRDARAKGWPASDALNFFARTPGLPKRWRGVWSVERPYRFADGQRLGFSTDLGNSYRIEAAADCLPSYSRQGRTTGFYTDAERSNTYAPRVLILGRRKGRGVVMLAGYEDIECGGYVFDASPLYSNEQGDALSDYARDAALAAYDIAERDAEGAREYNEAWEAGRDAAAALDDAFLASKITEYRDAKREAARLIMSDKARHLLEVLAEERAGELAELVAGAVEKWTETGCACEAAFREGFTENLSPDAWAAWTEWLEDTPFWGWRPDADKGA